jgi:DNA repair exonuclease SbcCD ATPase subunit
MGGELEGIVRELLSLARRKPLKGDDIARVRELMVRLREMGFTNMEISELTDGGWSEPTVKLYTRGATVKDPSPKENALRVLSQMIAAGLTLEDIEVAVSVKSDLEAKGVSLGDVSSLVEEARKSKMSLRDLVQTYKALKDSGLSAAQLAEALSYKSRLEEAGFTIEGLKEIYTASKAYGGYSGLIKAMNVYGSLESIEAEVKRMIAEKGLLEKQVNELKEMVEKLGEEKARIEGFLKLYDDLKTLGFDEEVLRRLKEASDRYGGVRDVLEAVNAYGGLAELRSEVGKLEERRMEVESELKKAEADHAHLQTIIGMCDTLLYKLKFSIPAVTEIYEVARRYGEPLEVLKAIGRYGELKALEAEIEKLTARRSELEARVRELSNQVQGLKESMDELKNTAKSLLKPFVDELRRNVELLRKKFSEAIDAISRGYDEYARRYGELNAECGRLEEELRLARILQSLVKYPSECVKLPLDYDILMLNAVMNHLIVKGVNPKVKAGDTISGKYGIRSYQEVELLDLIEWAMRGLKSSLASGG